MSQQPPGPPNRADPRGAWRPRTAHREPRSPGRGPGIDRGGAAAARRHSIFVTAMKGLLPSLAVGVVLALVFYSQGGFAPDLPDGIEFDPGEIDVSSSAVRMLNPLLTGLDNDNRRFEVTAISAVQDTDNPGLVTLDGINGSMELADGGWLTLDATGGLYNSDTNMLSLNDTIEVTTSAGYIARLNGAEVDFKKGEVATDRPVVVYMDAGVITGNAMTLFHKERRVVFQEGVSMTINGDPSQGSTGQ